MSSEPGAGDMEIDEAAPTQPVDVPLAVEARGGPSGEGHSRYRLKTEMTFDEERLEVEDRLDRFRREMEKMKKYSHKFDMIAHRRFNERGDLNPAPPGCHPPGIKLGDRFSYKAELAVCGIHQALVAGIDFKKGNAATAVVLSGGYADDEDHGSWFIYSGQGYATNMLKAKVKDQKWEGANGALRLCKQNQLPVRVVRWLLLNEDTEGVRGKRYVYEGLYHMKEAWSEIREERTVCMFRFEGLPGEHVVSGKVETETLYKGSSQKPLKSKSGKKKQIASPEMASPVLSRPAAQKKGCLVYGHATALKDMMKLDIERYEYLRTRPNVLDSDISDGMEAVKIPLINDTGIDVVPPQFAYIRHFDYVSEDAQRRIDEATLPGEYSGCQKDRARPSYGDTGLLQRMQPEGIRECPEKCLNCNNSIVADGIRYPLEVFRTEDKGWGVRCAVDIPSGAFICEYMGEILTDEEAEQPEYVADSTYLYSLDHFYLMKKDMLRSRTELDGARSSGEASPDVSPEKVPHLPLTDEQIMEEDYHGKYLVIDAKRKSNVGRFLNHACKHCANVVPQMVLSEGCSGVFHHVAFFALRDIPMYTELCYNYGWAKGVGTDIRCACDMAGSSGN